jgi:hypothetical protein
VSEPWDGDDVTPEELREAEALARALERGTADDAMPEDALETAAMLRYAHDEGHLTPEREGAILDELLARFPARGAARARPRFLRWLIPVVGLTSATAVVILVLRPAPEGGPISAVPAPSRELLEAQLEAAQGEPESGVALDRAMSAYRSELYAALDERYTR